MFTIICDFWSALQKPFDLFAQGVNQIGSYQSDNFRDWLIRRARSLRSRKNSVPVGREMRRAS